MDPDLKSACLLAAASIWLRKRGEQAPLAQECEQHAFTLLNTNGAPAITLRAT